MCSNTSIVCNAQISRPRIESKHLIGIQQFGSVRHKVDATLSKIRIVSFLIKSDTVCLRVSYHPNIQVSIREPSGGFTNIGHSAADNLGVQMVSKLLYEVGLDRYRSNKFIHVSGECIVCRDQVGFTGAIKLRSTSSAKYLLHI